MIRRHRRNIVVIIAALILSSMLLALLLGTATVRAESGLPAGLRASVNHMVLSQTPQGLEVVHMIDIANDSTEPSPELQIPLPPGAGNFQPMGGKAALRDGQVVIAAGIKPAEKLQIGFTYTLPAAETMELTFPDIPPADVSWLLLDEKTLTLDPTLLSNGLNDMGLAVISQVAYRQFVVDRPQPGQPVTIRVKAGGNPAAAADAVAKAAPGVPAGTAGGEKLLNQSFHGGNANVMVWQRLTGASGHGGLVGILIMGLAAVGLIGLVILLIRRYRAAAHRATATASATGVAETEGRGGDLDELLRQKAALARRIAELDLKAAGAPSEEMVRQRAVYKQALVQVIREIRDLQAQGD